MGPGGPPGLQNRSLPAYAGRLGSTPRRFRRVTQRRSTSSRLGARAQCRQGRPTRRPLQRRGAHRHGSFPSPRPLIARPTQPRTQRQAACRQSRQSPKGGLLVLHTREFSPEHAATTGFVPGRRRQMPRMGSTARDRSTRASRVPTLHSFPSAARDRRRHGRPRFRATNAHQASRLFVGPAGGARCASARNRPNENARVRRNRWECHVRPRPRTRFRRRSVRACGCWRMRLG
jgi:hypothetical protein